MVKKTLFKYSSVLMSVVLIASTLTACGTNTAYNQVSSEVAVSSEAASNTESIICYFITISSSSCVNGIP